MNNKTKDTIENDQPGNNYIVGIGASAGGLEAINEFFDNMPVPTGFSFVIVQHLSPDHKSLMGELLSKHTEMPVFQAAEDMMLKPDSIYLIPTGKTITLKQGRLRLEDKKRDQQPNNAIDIFFESLAIDKAEKSVAIILSGTGTDGTRGIQSIKSRGGTVLVQDPSSAQFDGMPNSAISSGYVDLILSPDMMAEELLEFIKEAPLIKSFNALNKQEEAALLDILELVYRNTGHDFSNYKRPTITRRLAKRIAEKNIKSLPDYYNYLGTCPDEIEILCKEFLLHVTRFFRDEEACNTLQSIVIPDIVLKRGTGDPVKVWTVACSTGEEAYSLAILFDECLPRLNKPGTEVKIFASDISQDVIDFASRGVYTEEQLKGVSADRLKRYFIKDSNSYRVIPAIRKMIVFARHDVLKDPPFSKIDLITCRNMLIYMNPLLQKGVMQKFHFSINDDGYLFLGPSENISILKDVMVEVDKKWKIFKCVSKTKVADLESFSNPSERILQTGSFTLSKSKNALNCLPDIFKDTLLEEYDYAGIFIDKDFEVKQAMGSFKKFLEFPEGSFNFNLLKLVPQDLSIALSTGIRKAMKDKERVVQRNVAIKDGKSSRYVTLIIKPYLTQKTYLQPFVFIILKEEDPLPGRPAPAPLTREGYTTERIEELEQELSNTRENLQALIEEVESANEELQSSNEEIVSSNEELQSTNEELQSLNEELHTVNSEHQLKIKELMDMNDDMNNYFTNTDIGQILLDRKMIIRKFTPVATKQVNLITSDIGRSILDISTNMKDLNFINDIKSVIRKGEGLEKEISMDQDRIYLMRIAPYVRQNKTIDGVVISFIDITDSRKLNNILEAVLNSSSNGILALKTIRNENGVITDFKFVSANRASEQLLDLEDGIVHRNLADIFGDIDPKTFEIYRRVVESDQAASLELFYKRTSRWFDITAVKMMDGLVITFSDITEKKISSERIQKGYDDLKITSRQLEISNYKLQQSNLDLLQFASVASHDLKEPLRKIQVFGNLLKDRIKEGLDPQAEIYLNKVIHSSNRMQTLIDNILILSRLSRVDTKLSPVDLNEVVRQIIDDLEISIRDKGVEINVNPLPAVKGITGQMHQLFQNLISNAIKFNQGNPVITIWAEPATMALREEYNISAKDYTTIHIRDNGIGFDQRFSQKIFAIFQRLDPTHYQGTGIGLTIVKKIVENHKGYIKALGKPGEGAHFILVLPV
ncbi:MAG: CheR family methyltransferase [Puia sp.]|nr:CheR family methyltransferase [Puia sp.]